MRKVTIPGTRLETSRIGFGTASLHHLLGEKARQALLGAAFDLGISHFDTARMYGNGLAERELGRFLIGKRQQATIGTKLGIPAVPALERWPALMYVHKGLGVLTRRFSQGADAARAGRFSLADAEDSLHRSLRALRTDWVDVLFLHEPRVDEVNEVAALGDWLLRQKREGRVRYLGLAGKVDDCLQVAQRTAGLFDILQVEDSEEQREADRLVKEGWPLQITYGYLRRSLATTGSLAAKSVVAQALERNSEGMVLVSSRNPKRLAELALIAEGVGE